MYESIKPTEQRCTTALPNYKPSRRKPLDKNSILQRAENVTFEVVADEAILIDITTGIYFSLNEVGTEFWQMLDGEQTVAQHATIIASKYEVEPDMVVADLLELAEEMAKDKLILIH
jgi:hypothetical protein